MIWKTDYINLFLAARKNLNYKNIEKLSLSQIEHIGKMYDQYYFSHYKKQVFFRWFEVYRENTLAFSKRVKKLIKKINIDLSEIEKFRVDSIESKEFTQYRALKTLEIPYKFNSNALLLSPFAFFSYKNCRTYFKKIFLLEQLFIGEIFLTPKEIVFYNREKKQIQKVLKNSNIKRISLLKYSIKIEVFEGDDLYLRYKDNELIYISLNRTIKQKINEVEFKKEDLSDSNTTEKTIELIFK